MCAVLQCFRIQFDSNYIFTAVSNRMRGLVRHTLTIAAILFTWSQNGLVYSQECDKESQGSCCQTTNATCPPRYYSDDNCQTMQPTTSSTTMEDAEDSNSTDNGVTNSSFTEENNTTDASTTTTTLTSTISCKRCNSNCSRCIATACLECDTGFDLEDGGCKEKEKKENLPIGAIAGGAAGGFVLIVVVIVVVICCCRGKQSRSGTENMDIMLEDRNRLNNKDDVSEGVNEAGSLEASIRSAAHPTYENTAFVHENMSTQIEEGQDRVLRYTRDPTYKKEIVDEPVYGNRAIIESNILNELGEAPAPPGPVKKHKKAAARSPGPVKKHGNAAARSSDPMEEQQEEELYYNESAGRHPDTAYVEEACGDDDMEIYCNEGADQVEEDDEEELYVNYQP